MRFADLPVGSWYTHPDLGGSYLMKIDAEHVIVFRHVGKVPIGPDVELEPILTAIPGD